MLDPVLHSIKYSRWEQIIPSLTIHIIWLFSAMITWQLKLAILITTVCAASPSSVRAAASAQTGALTNGSFVPTIVWTRNWPPPPPQSFGRRQKKEVIPRSSFRPTDEYVQLTSAPFMENTLLTWDANGNLILNAQHSGSAKLTLEIGDHYSALLIADLFEAYHGTRPKMGWSRLSLCYVLAVLKKDVDIQKKVSFAPEQCSVDAMFQIDKFAGPNDIVWNRMDSCYQTPSILNSYARCIRRKAAGYGLESPCKLTALEHPEKFRDSVFGSHVRAICETNTEDILKYFDGHLANKEAIHELIPFDVELCHLQSYFRPGKLTICFPVQKHAKAHSAHYSQECGFGKQMVTVEYVDALSLRLTIGDEPKAPNTRFLVSIELMEAPSKILCRRLSFNRYQSSDGGDDTRYWDRSAGKSVAKWELPKNLIPICTRLLKVEGMYGTVADEAPITVHNTFSNTHFFLRIGRCPNIVRCYWGYSPTIYACNNKAGVSSKKCTYTIQTSTATSVGTETAIEQDSTDKIAVGAGTAVLKEAFKFDVSFEHQEHTSRVQKFLENLQKGRSQSVTEEVVARAGERLEVWQLAYSCLDHKYFLPVLELKRTTSDHPAIQPQMRNADEDDGFGQALAATSFGNAPIALYTGPCDFPSSPAYNRTECHHVRVPEDLKKKLNEMIDKIKVD